MSVQFHKQDSTMHMSHIPTWLQMRNLIVCSASLRHLPWYMLKTETICIYKAQLLWLRRKTTSFNISWLFNSKIIPQAEKAVNQQIISLFGFGKSYKSIHPDKNLLTWANNLFCKMLYLLSPLASPYYI